ncbi:F-box/FBD/LRR-repeat protein At4g26340-like [Chenopodium quinoa]|uniref:F-box/FBD/LRR-repeat protein At4g26340-like n=1 Tax=Chenopodium quinoa TaxID=63459 RepID=UPI000B792ADD|nr:F-box/FBD/LRR-repeat protein At4g26340-like [Chenopodium quinoa]
MEISKNDRISDLPKHIRQHILSFLPYKQAIATSLLSTTWRFDWFNIENSYFPELWRSYDQYYDNLTTSHNPISRYLHFLDNTLRRIRYFLGDDQLSIPNLKLRIHPLLAAFSPDIAEFLPRLKVKNLSLSIFLDFDFNNSNDFVISSVSTLPMLSELEIYNNYLPSSIVPCLAAIVTRRLQKLSLISITIEQSKIDKVIVGCNCIESLSFEQCVGLTYLNLVGVSKLTELVLKYNSNLASVVMDDGATNFRYLEYVPSELFDDGLLVLSNVGSLEERDLMSSKLPMGCVNFRLSNSCSIKKLKISCDILVQNALCMSDLEILNIVCLEKRRLDLLRLDSCKRLTHLHITTSYSMTDECLNSNLSRLGNLKVLEIKYCDELRHVKIAQEHLKTLILYNCRSLECVVMDCPNLSHFKYEGYIVLDLVGRSIISPCSFVELACYRFSKIVHANLLAVLNIFGNSKHLTLRNLRIEVLIMFLIKEKYI